MNRLYCFECKRKVNYTINEKEMIYIINGVNISFIGKEVTCNYCNGLISLRDITNEDIKKGNDKYRDVLGIIKTEEIKEILEVYTITQVEEKIGCKTIIDNYLKGLMPTKECSDNLRKILKEAKGKIFRIGDWNKDWIKKQRLRFSFYKFV